MTENHPITPPPALVKQWWEEADKQLSPYRNYIATQAAQWGADQQLEQCEKYWMTLGSSPEGVVAMRHALRPKPPSLKEQALYALDEALSSDCIHLKGVGDTIRRALEALPD